MFIDFIAGDVCVYLNIEINTRRKEKIVILASSSHLVAFDF